jgi:hypothetical protein
MSTTKEQLDLMIKVSFPEPLDSIVAYKSYENFNKLIHESDKDTIKYFCDMVSKDKRGLLKLRQEFAENGYELTPNECIQYMFILATCLLDFIEELKVIKKNDNQSE